jgi:putative nucleotidyltransferase with HDIG domain
MDYVLARKIIGGVRELPTLPCALNRLRQVLENTNANNASLASVIASDPCLTARALRVSNSAYYVTQKLCDISKSVSQLGFAEISQIAGTMPACKTFEDDADGRFDRAEFWRHSIAVAVIARTIAAQTGTAAPTDAYTCGLLHDIGKVVLDQFLHEEFAQALAKAAARGKPLIAAEREISQIDHAIAGEMFARAWRMPAPVIAAIRWHHVERSERRGLAASDEVFADIVRVADAAAHDLGIGASGCGAPPPKSSDAIKRLRLSDGALERIRASAPPEIDRASDALDLPKRTLATR